MLHFIYSDTNSSHIQPKVIMPPTKRKTDALLGEHPSGRQSKKSSCEADESTTPLLPDLPAPVWGRVLNFLPYGDIRKAMLLSRTIAFDAPPHVFFLSIYKASEMNVRAIRRFCNVKETQIHCVIRDGILNPNAVGRVVPFISAFPKLTYCGIGGPHMARKIKNHYNVNRCTSTYHKESFRSMLEALCGAFEADALPRSLILDGFLFPYKTYSCDTETDEDDQPCRLCPRILRCFPLNAIAPVPGISEDDDFWESSGQTFCIDQDECRAIMLGRKWTGMCKRALHRSKQIKRLLFLRKRTLKPKFKRGGTVHSSLYFLPSQNLRQLELIREVAGKFRIGRKNTMRSMRRSSSAEVYLLNTFTFNRLRKLGFKLREKDFHFDEIDVPML